MQPLRKARYTTGRIAARLGRIVKRQRLKIHTMTSEIAARSARRVKRKRLKIQTKEKTVSFNQEFHLKRPKLNPSGRNTGCEAKNWTLCYFNFKQIYFWNRKT